MRLSDAGLRQRQTKVLYPNHRLPPWLTEGAARDRSNRLLDGDGIGFSYDRSMSPYASDRSDAARVRCGIHGDENARVNTIDDIAGHWRIILFKTFDVKKSLLRKHNLTGY